MNERQQFDPRAKNEADAIVNEAMVKAEGAAKPPIQTMIDDLQYEIDLRLSSARIWTRDGYDVVGEEWTRRLGVLYAIIRLLKFIKAHEREIAKATKKNG